MTRISKKLKSLGLSSKELGEKTGFSQKRISDILKGSELKLSELNELSKSLGVSLMEFSEPTTPPKKASLLFRQSMEVSRVMSHPVNFIYRNIEKFNDILSGSSSDFSWRDELRKHADSPVDLARHFRHLHIMGDQISPLNNLPNILEERLNIILLVVKNNSFDGASAIVNNNPFIFVSARFKPRMLFTLAHELGHILAHHNEVGDFAYYDEDLEKNVNNKDPKEEFADQFAKSLLIPEKGLGIALKEIRRHLGSPENEPVGDLQIIYLANIFGVSFIVAARRCEEFGVIPKGGAYSLYEKLKKSYGSPEKRAKDLNVPSRPEAYFSSVPKRLLDASLLKIRNGEMSIGKASSLLNVSIENLVEKNRGVNA